MRRTVCSCVLLLKLEAAGLVLPIIASYVYYSTSPRQRSRSNEQELTWPFLFVFLFVCFFSLSWSRRDLCLFTMTVAEADRTAVLAI